MCHIQKTFKQKSAQPPLPTRPQAPEMGGCYPNSLALHPQVAAHLEALEAPHRRRPTGALLQAGRTLPS